MQLRQERVVILEAEAPLIFAVFLDEATRGAARIETGAVHLMYDTINA